MPREPENFGYVKSLLTSRSEVNCTRPSWRTPGERRQEIEQAKTRAYVTYSTDMIET